MRLSYGEDAVLKKSKTMHRLLNTYFDSLFRNINLNQFNSRFEELDFEVMDNIDTLKDRAILFCEQSSKWEKKVTVKSISHCLMK